MQPSGRRQTALPIMILVLSLSGPMALAAVLDAGMHGMTWGGRAADYPRLEKIGQAGEVSYFADRRMVYQTAGQPVSGVIYGFYRDQFFAAYIKLHSPNQAYYLERHFSGEYGPAKVTTSGAAAQTVYRWQDGDLKIKLKVNQAGDEIKLGIYFQPLSNKLNQTLVEEGPADAYTPTPSEHQDPESAPLL